MDAQHNHQIPEGKFIREAVFGFNDGLVSTFGLTAGIVGALSSNHLVALAGLINALAGAISMSVGTYISTKSEEEVLQREIEQEKEQLEKNPKQEIKELIRIYKEKGFKGRQLDCVIDTISRDKNLFLKTMVDEELGIADTNFKNPIKASLIMFLFFVLGAAIPTVAYLFVSTTVAVAASALFSLCALFVAGIVKSRLTKRNAIKSGTEMVLIGVIAAVSAYGFGTLLHIWFGI